MSAVYHTRMEFLTLQQADLRPFRTVYRYSTVGTAVLFFVFAGLTGTGAVFISRMWADWSLSGFLLSAWFTLWFGIFTLIIGGTLRARLGKTNWLVRTETDGLQIKFRSYLNYHLNENDAIVLQLSYDEIEFARVHRVRQVERGTGDDGDTIKFKRFAEFAMHHKSPVKELAKRLIDERNRQAPWHGRLLRSRTKALHCPVQVLSDGFVRIQWDVRPGLTKFIEEISAQVPIVQPAKSRLDYRNLQQSTREQQQNALLTLIASGDRLSAIRLIRQLYGYDLTRAQQFFDDVSENS